MELKEKMVTKKLYTEVIAKIYPFDRKKPSKFKLISYRGTVSENIKGY